MSGGELEYLYSKVQRAIDDIHDFEIRSLENYYGENGGDVWSTYQPFQTPKHKRFLKHLSRVADALKSIEWVMSGDCSEGDEIKFINRVLNERTRNGRSSKKNK